MIKKIISFLILILFFLQSTGFAAEISDNNLENLQEQNIVINIIDNNDKNLQKALKQNNPNYIKDGADIIVVISDGLLLGSAFVTTLPVALIGFTLYSLGLKEKLSETLMIPFIAVFTMMILKSAY